MAKDKGVYKAQWKIEKYKGDFASAAEAEKLGKPYDTVELEGNLLLNEGINNLWTHLCGGAATAYSNANARIGVGNSTTAAQATDTGLLGASQLYKAMDATYPTYGSSQQVVFRSTFGSTEANWAWEEITVDNGATAAINLNRKVQAMGTKASGTTWVATLTITLS